jgi:hypothetical protein
LGLAASSPPGIAETEGAQPAKAQPARTPRDFQHGTARAPGAIVYVRGKDRFAKMDIAHYPHGANATWLPRWQKAGRTSPPAA